MIDRRGSGVTQQGQPITFTVSEDDKLTSIVVGYNFNGCSGTQTFSNLNIDTRDQVECFPGPCPSSVTSSRSIAYDNGDPFQGQYTSVRGFIAENPGSFVGEGAVSFRNYPGCGGAQTRWSVSRK